MNRAQRRNAAKQNAAGFRKAAHVTDAGIEQRLRLIEKETHMAAQNHFMGLMYCVFALVLRRMLKFGPVRTLRVLSEVAAIINDLNDGIITVFDVKREAEEAGIKVVFDTNYDMIECGIFEEDEYAAARKKIDEERMLLYENKKLKGLRLWTDPVFEALMKGEM